jgi:hypothetical protein
MRKIKTIGEKCDELIAAYEKLNHEANDMLDLYLDELRLTCPGVPIGSLKMMTFNRAGSTRDMIEVLKILKERKSPAN